MYKPTQTRTLLVQLCVSLALTVTSGAVAQVSTPSLSPTAAPDMTPNLNSNTNTGSTTSSANANNGTAANSGFVLGSKLMGIQVRYEQNQTLGTISNLVVNPDTGHIRYVVIDVNGRKVTVPWNALNAAPHATSGQAPHFTLNTTKEKLSKAPKFNPSDLSNLSNRTAEEPIFTYYDIIWFPDVLSGDEQNARNASSGSGMASSSPAAPSVTPYGGTSPNPMTAPAAGSSITPFPTAGPH